MLVVDDAGRVVGLLYRPDCGFAADAEAVAHEPAAARDGQAAPALIRRCPIWCGWRKTRTAPSWPATPLPARLMGAPEEE